ncbi:MAG: hypothetical protein QXL01_00035 [Thermoplasmatales archaeon]
MFTPDMNFTNIPFLVEGEIIGVSSYSGKMKGISKKFFYYVCRATMQDGSQVILNNVVAASMFGGIGDYFQVKHKGSADVPEDVKYGLNDDRNTKTIGDRVLISFVNGHITKPVIVAFLPHPQQTDEFQGKDHKTLKPQFVWQYNGIRVKIDDEGQLSVIHKGAPEIKDLGANSGQLAGAVGAAASAISGAASDPDPSNPAVIFKPTTERTLFEMLKDGVFRIRDAEGQIIEIDRTKKRIYISNNDIKSTESIDGSPLSGGLQLLTNSTDAEYVLLDKDKELVLINARSIAQIYSFDKRKDVTEGNHSHKILGDSEWTIQGNEKQLIGGSRDHKINEDDKLLVGGNKEETIIGDRKETITGKKDVSIVGDHTAKVGGSVSEQYTGSWEVVALGGITLNGSLGVLKLADGKVGLGGPTAELLDLVDQLLQQLDTLITQMQLETHTGNLGYPTSPPLNAAAYAAVQTAISVIKTLLGTIKGGI